jgi:excinuclease ABC subunit A
VGTSTEVVDHLRLLFARAGEVHCDACGIPVPRRTLDAIAAEAGGTGRRVIAFPVDPGSRPGPLRRSLAERGYLRGWHDGETVEVGDLPARGPWWIVQDRIAADRRGRLREAVEGAAAAGEGRVVVIDPADGTSRTLAVGRVCEGCGARYPEPEPVHFSFNSPAGACPTCKGFGYDLVFDPAKIVPDPALSLEEGALHPFAGKWRSWFLRRLEACPRARRIPRSVPWTELDEEDRRVLLHGGDRFPGAVPWLEARARKSYKAGNRFLVKRYRSPERCGDCGGARIGPAGRRVRLDGDPLPAWCALSIDALARRVAGLPLPAELRRALTPLLEDLAHRIEVLLRVGVGYLSLDRPVRTLSGGESQRIELAQALGSRLVDSLYVLDEPTIGLHPRDTERMLAALAALRDGGNTVVVVEHDPEVMRRADWMVELGPGSGRDGGGLVYAGPVADRAAGPASPTRDVLTGRGVERHAPREPDGWLRLRDLRLHNLDGVDADLPLGVLVGVCGVSGSGKSTLVRGVLVPRLERAVSESSRRVEGPEGRLELDRVPTAVRVVDQTPLGRSARSIPASYVGAWDGIRALYASLPEARRRGHKPGTYSFNTAGGRCEACRGEGETRIDMDFMADVRLPCEVCAGRRFQPEIESVRFRGRSIADVLGLTVDEGIALFDGHPAIQRPLWALARVGLGYLGLGQPAATLSGGEAQRLKLVRELGGGRRGQVIVLDEPTVGLHAAEVDRLLAVLTSLVEAGHTVLVIEHHLELLAACDWIVELGPDGGETGGRLIAAGPPASVAREGASVTGPHLGPLLAGGRATV